MVTKYFSISEIFFLSSAKIYWIFKPYWKIYFFSWTRLSISQYLWPIWRGSQELLWGLARQWSEIRSKIMVLATPWFWTWPLEVQYYDHHQHQLDQVRCLLELDLHAWFLTLNTIKKCSQTQIWPQGAEKQLSKGNWSWWVMVGVSLEGKHQEQFIS